MNIRQAFKMAWKSIWGKKGRSALTILGIFIGIAAVMTIVSVMEGMKQKSMEQFEAMGTNRITVDIYSWSWDEEGNQISKDYFPDLYDYCNSLKEYVVGTTPTAWANVTVTYGTKSSANMEWEYDDNWNVISAPPDQFYGSDQYSVCNNLTIAKGRDLAYLDVESYHQVCVLGAKAARIFFGTADPVGKIMQVNGQNFEVVGVYAARVDPDSSNAQMDNFIVYPYTARRVLGGIAAISLVVGGIGIMNIMLVTVTERTREIGIRRAIGAQRSSIVAQFLIEAAMLCGIGGIIGILVGTLGSVVLSTLLMQMTIYPPVKVTIGAFALSVALGIIFGIYPAAKASKLQPVEALRAE